MPMKSAAMSSLIIVPTIEELSRSQRRNVTCSAQGCDRIFSQVSALRLHLVKVHRIIESDQDLALLQGSVKPGQLAQEKRYHCPVEGCKYNRLLGRSFTSMALLKQHYIHVHAEKKYKCGRCGTGYAQQRDLDRHEKNCQLMFVCAKCTKIYNSREALITHCRRENHKSNFEGVNREAFGIQDTSHPTQESSQSKHVSTSEPNCNKKSPPVSLICKSQPQSVFTIQKPGNILKTVPSAKSTAKPLPTNFKFIKGNGGVYTLAGGMTPMTVRYSNKSRQARSLLNAHISTSTTSGSLSPQTQKLSTTSYSPASANFEVTVDATASSKSPGSSRCGPLEISKADLQRNRQNLQAIDMVKTQGKSFFTLCLKETETISSGHQTVLSVPKPAYTRSAIQATCGQSLNPKLIPVASVAYQIPNAVAVPPAGTVSNRPSSVINDPKSIVMGLLKSDLFKNWSCYVKSGIDPSKAFETASDSLKKHRVMLNEETVEKNKQNSDVINLQDKMMNDIQSLQMKTDFLSLIQETDIGCTQTSVKDQVTELLKDMKSELKKLQDTCKAFVTQSSPSIIKYNQAPQCVEKMSCNTVNIPTNILRSKSKLLLPKPNILMLPVNFQTNGSISTGQKDPLVFICDTSSVPLKRKTPKPIKPKPTSVSLTSSGRLSSTATMTDPSAQKIQAQDMEMQTDCASFTSRGVGTNVTAMGNQTQTQGNTAFAVGSQTFDMSDVQGVHIGVQTSASNNKRASGTQTSQKSSLENPFDIGIDVIQPKRRKGKTQKESSVTARKHNLGKQRKRGKRNESGILSGSWVPGNAPLIEDSNNLESQLMKDVSVGDSDLLTSLSRPGTVGCLPRDTGKNKLSRNDPMNIYSTTSKSDKGNCAVPEQRLGQNLNPDVNGSISLAKGNDSSPSMSGNIVTSSPFISQPCLQMDTVSISNRDADPLPGFSGAQLDDNDSLSLFSSQHTQTSLWKELEESIMAESNSTQTMESFLTDSSLQSSSLAMPTLMESGVQASSAQHSQTQTLCNDVPLSQSKSVGVGTTLLDDTSPLLEGMESEGFSRSVGIDTQLFDDLFPEVSSRSVAISTPLFDGHNPHSVATSVGTSTFQTIEQSSVSVGCSPGPVFPVSPLPTNDQSQNTNLNQSTFGTSTPTLRYESIATASVQTDTDLELRSFLTSGSQTTDFDTSYINMETQTVDEMYDQLLSNMETQTTDAFLAGFGFVDIETQTYGSNQESASVETQTSQLATSTNRLFQTSSSSTSSSMPDFSLRSSTSSREPSVSIDTETQTLLPNLHITENCFTDSHTQTTIDEFESLVKQLEKQ